MWVGEEERVIVEIEVDELKDVFSLWGISCADNVGVSASRRTLCTHSVDPCVSLDDGG